jgi:5-(carboxyamino)imidazole ribonucleotide synthase
MNSWPLGFRVGILGGGQLARMLAQSAQQMGFEVHVLCPDAMEPAAQVTRFHHQGSPSSPRDLASLLKSVDAVTFESEFLDMDVLAQATREGLRVFPEPSLMQILQDRRTQKDLLEKFKIPTAPFRRIDFPHELSEARKMFPAGFVLKKARGGYDGYGTFYARRESDLDLLARDFPGPSIAEKLIRFQRELAVVAVCGEKDFCFLPLVESKQTQSRCDWVKGPVAHKAWPKMAKSIQKMLKKIGYRGVIAFELFDTGRELLVNEIAPRVHNSGHYSMQALSKSQFDLHWEAGLGLRFQEPTLSTKAFVMTNLIGESTSSFRIPEGLTGKLHWYGKKDNRPGRKMGHLNYVGASAETLLRKALQERKRIGK